MGLMITILNQVMTFAAAKDQIILEGSSEIMVLQEKMEWTTGTTIWTILGQFNNTKFFSSVVIQKLRIQKMKITSICCE